MKRLAIAAQVRLGIAVQTLLMIILSGVAAVTLVSISNALATLQTISATADVIQHKSDSLQKMEAASLRFRLAADKSDAAVVQDTLASLKTSFTQSSEVAALSNDAAILVDQISATLVNFDNVFVSVTNTQDQLQEKIAELREIQDRLKEQMKTLRGKLEFSFDAAPKDRFNLAERVFLASQTYFEKFLLTGTSASFQNAEESFGNARRYAGQVTRILKEEGMIANAKAIEADMDLLWETTKTIARLNRLFNNLNGMLLGESGQLREDMAKLVEISDNELAIVAASTEKIQQDALIKLAIGVAIAVLLAAYSTWYLPRRINLGLQRSVKTMTALAQGELEVKIASGPQPKELAAISQALALFRDQALEKRQLDKKAKEAAEAEAERQEQELARQEQRAREQAEAQKEQERVMKERQLMLEDLEASVGGVVAAAVRGDFSQRIRKQFDQDEIQSLSDAINGLMVQVDKGLSETQRVLARLADGDLSDRMQGGFSGAFADLQKNLNGSIQTLGQIVVGISDECDALKVQSGTVSGVSGQASKRAEEQAAALEQTAAALEEIMTTLESSNSHLDQISTFAEMTAEQADNAGQVTDTTMEAMSEIEDASREIEKILTVMEEIAFQTNLLALNASVEAARAGSAGKGFAVVANEVRALAQRSHEASHGIKDLINKSSGSIGRGVELVGETSTVMGTIVEGVREINTSLQQLKSSSSEQKQGMGEISRAMSALDKITQSNVELAESSRNAASQMSEQVFSIEDKVSTLQTEDPTSETAPDPAQDDQSPSFSSIRALNGGSNSAAA